MMATTLPDGPIYCDCCHRFKLAEVRGGRIVVARRKDREIHTAVIVLTSANGCASMEAVGESDSKTMAP